MTSRISYALAVVMLLVAAALRLWQLTTLPIGLNPQEMANVDLMRDSIQRGDIRVFYEIAGEGQEGFYHSTLAIAALLFGSGTFGFRFLSVIASMLTLALTYSLGRRLFGPAGALVSIALLAVAMWPVLLARLVLVETLLPLLVSAVLFMMARAMPVYPYHRTEDTSTVDYAILGLLLGISLYVHPAGLMIVLMAMVFITYILLSVRPLSMRQLSYSGFAILMTIIVAMPYVISTIRLPEYNASRRIFGNYESITFSILDSVAALLLEGDSNVLYNLPLRPIFDLFSGMIVLLGAVISVMRWREPRYALLLIAAIFLAPPALLGDQSPNFVAMSLLLPVIALFFGLGLNCLFEQSNARERRIGLVLALALLLFNIGWTGRDLFRHWPAREDVQIAYNSHIARIAHHLDLTAETIPTVLCYPGWDRQRNLSAPLSPAQQVLLLMNRDDAPLRYADCSSGLVFADGGEQFQVVIPAPEMYAQIPPEILNWLALGTTPETVPDRAVVQLAIQRELADALGIFTTTTPANLATATDVSDRIPVPPPIRFGGNVTWLGYQPDPVGIYEAGQPIFVTTYWRVEGVTPRDLTIFTHLLSDPVTIAANHDTIHVNPAQLRGRDVFLNITRIVLPRNMLSGTYEVSTGLYQNSSDTRLPVLINDGEVRGNRIFLYPIEVRAINP